MNLENLHHWIQNVTSNGPVAVISGKNGDMDTIGSAIALAAINPGMMACGLHMGKLAKRVCKDLQAPFKLISSNHQWPLQLSGVIFVDAASISQTGVTIPNDVPYCVIDHHATSDWEFREIDFEYRNQSRSTTQMIFEYLESYHKKTLTDEVRKLLLAGLITDTGRFMHADEHALECASKLVAGGNFEYQKFVEEVQNEQISPSDRGAIIKSLNRCKSIDVGSWNLIQSTAGILEGKVASLLLQTGGDVSLVSRHKDGETRLTARAKRGTTSQGVHLGNMMKKLSEQLGGEGGGHDGAAGWSGNIDSISAESAFINILANTRRTDL